MPKKAKPVELTGRGKMDYTFDALSPVEVDVENLMRTSVEAEFHAGQSIDDGCSGKLEIDTSYENTSQPTMELVSSDMTRYENVPAPRDKDRHKYPHREY